MSALQVPLVLLKTSCPSNCCLPQEFSCLRAAAPNTCCKWPRQICSWSCLQPRSNHTATSSPVSCRLSQAEPAVGLMLRIWKKLWQSGSISSQHGKMQWVPGHTMPGHSADVISLGPSEYLTWQFNECNEPPLPSWSPKSPCPQGLCQCKGLILVCSGEHHKHETLQLTG